jgi:hypothetical protein
VIGDYSYITPSQAFLPHNSRQPDMRYPVKKVSLLTSCSGWDRGDMK